MTVEEHRAGAYRDLRLALHTAASLQATIRHADAKAQILLALQGGMAAVVLQQAPVLGGVRTPALLAVAAVAAVALLAGLAVGGWQLLATIAPRLAGAHQVNRFAFPVARPATVDIVDQRDEAWDLVAGLADIALAKHARVRRALPAVVVASAAAGALVTLATTVSIVT